VDDDTSFNFLDQPTADEVRSISPYAYMLCRQYQTPSYFVHGRSDRFVPWQQAQKAYEALRANGVPCGLSLLEDEGHLFDVDYHDPAGKKWEACEQAYRFLHSFLLPV
jgi:acetyl esterase/lipase